MKNRPALGDSQSNVGKNLMTLAGTYNQAWLKNYEDADGNYQNWNGNDHYNKNPYWDLYKNSNTSDKDVFRFTGKAIWNIDKHLKLQGTIGTDINSMNFEDFIAKTTPRYTCRKAYRPNLQQPHTERGATRPLQQLMGRLRCQCHSWW